MEIENGTRYVAGGGLLILLGAATVEQTGLLPGAKYEFKSADGNALIRWGTEDASAADGGFDFCVRRNGDSIRAMCPPGITAVNVIEATVDSSATAAVLMSRIDNQ